MTHAIDEAAIRAGAEAAFAQAVSVLADRHGTVDVVRALEQSEADTPIARVARAAESWGLRVTRGRGTLTQAVSQASEGAPVLVSCGDGALERWVVVLGSAGRRVRFRVVRGGEVGPTLERRPDEVPLEAGWGAQDELEWMRIAASTPNTAAAAARGPKPSPVRRLALLLRPDRSDLWTILAFSIATGVLLLAVPIAVQALVNFVAFGGAIPQLVVVALLLLLGLAFAAALNATQTWVVEILQRRIFVRMVADLAARLPRVTLAARGHGYGPELVNRFFDIVTIQKVGSSLLLDGLSVLLSVLVGLVVLAFYHPLLLAFDIVLLVVIALLVLAPARRGIASAIQESKAKYRVAAWLEEIARNPLTFKTTGAERWVQAQSDRLAHDYLTARRNHYKGVFGQVVGVLTLQALASTALLAIGGLLVIQGSLTLGQLVAAELIVTLVVGSVAKMGKHIEGFYDLTAAVDKIGELLDLPTESRQGEYPVLSERGLRLTLDRVSGSREPGRSLFEDLSLEVPPGSSLGITGGSGSGKSLLLELCWDLRQPESGTVRFDGRDLRDLSPSYIRSVASLTAPTEIVGGTLRDNIRLSRPDVSNDEVRAALTACGLAERVARLPEGTETRLAPDGHPLSAGEVQSLIIARAIVGRPRLLLFDSALDHLASNDRRRALDVLFADDSPWTLVVVSNTPDVLERCERVLEMPSGRIRLAHELQTTSASGTP